MHGSMLSALQDWWLQDAHSAEQVPGLQLIIRGKADPAALCPQALASVLLFLRLPLPQDLQQQEPQEAQRG